MGMPIHVCIHLSLQIVKRSAIRKTNAGYDQGTLSGVSLNLLCDLICP